MGVTDLIFELLALKAKTKGVLTGYTVAMEINNVKKMIKTCRTMIGHLLYIISVIVGGAVT